MGARKKAKGGGGRRQTKHATPADSGTARSAGNQPGKPPAGHLLGKFCQCRRRLNAGDARGEAPCIKKAKNLPLPAGKGAGGMGAENQAKVRGGRRPKQPRHPTRQRGGGGQATNKARHPPGTANTGTAKKPERQGSPPCPRQTSQQPTINTYSLSRFPSWSAERHTDPNPPSRAPCRAHRARQTESPPHGRQDR